MHFVDYEEQYFNLISTVLRKGYKLLDDTVGYHATLRYDLESYIPLLHCTCVSVQEVNDILQELIDTIPESLLLGLGNSWFKPVRLYSSCAIPDISITVSKERTLDISATFYEVNLVDDVPRTFALISALGKYLCETQNFKPGVLTVTYNFVHIPVSDEPRISMLLKNNRKIMSLDHPYKRYALQEEWKGSYFKVPNYKVNKTCFPPV